VNFLAHLWLTERAQLPLAGAILGDVLRGALPRQMPEPLARSVQLHRRVDAHTDRHPAVVQARQAFAPGFRRYAGIVLDLVYDHALAADWASFCAEPLPAFAARAGRETAEAEAWFRHAGDAAPAPEAFASLLESYARPAGLDHAIRRTANRLRVPQGLLDAASDWLRHLPTARASLPALLADLARL
jgi:acyl carrier protein phosphodiesterase